MFMRTRSQTIPPNLRIEVSVKINDPRRHGQAADVEHAVGSGLDTADLLNLAITDRDVAEERRQTRAVVNPSASKDHFIHSHTSSRRLSPKVLRYDAAH